MTCHKGGFGYKPWLMTDRRQADDRLTTGWRQVDDRMTTGWRQEDDGLTTGWRQDDDRLSSHRRRIVVAWSSNRHKGGFGANPGLRHVIRGGSGTNPGLWQIDDRLTTGGQQVDDRLTTGWRQGDDRLMTGQRQVDDQAWQQVDSDTTWYNRVNSGMKDYRVMTWCRARVGCIYHVRTHAHAERGTASHHIAIWFTSLIQPVLVLAFAGAFENLHAGICRIQRWPTATPAWCDSVRGVCGSEMSILRPMELHDVPIQAIGRWLPDMAPVFALGWWNEGRTGRSNVSNLHQRSSSLHERFKLFSSSFFFPPFSHFVYMKQGGPSHGFMSTIAKLLLIRIVSQSKVHRAGGWQEDVGNIRKPLALNRLVAKVSPQHCLSIFENIILMWLTCLAHIALNDAFATSCRCKALMLRDPNQSHLRLGRDTWMHSLF